MAFAVVRGVGSMLSHAFGTDVACGRITRLGGLSRTDTVWLRRGPRRATVTGPGPHGSRAEKPVCSPADFLLSSACRGFKL